ncbi:hypothetical protein [Pectobacterium versatile]|uniref:hypothetical protein n=1 Tax=Pectobacterium versatile TaxID=2488639 RepID=UPI001F459EA7|nr:hypothetical protein [Pectobacterium versatile]
MKHYFLFSALLCTTSTHAMMLEKTCLTETGITFSLSMTENHITVNGAKRQITNSKSSNDPQTLKGYTDYWAGENETRRWNYVNVEIEHDTGKVTGYIAISPQPAILYKCD